jgi:hypothetical protein
MVRNTVNAALLWSAADRIAAAAGPQRRRAERISRSRRLLKKISHTPQAIQISSKSASAERAAMSIGKRGRVSRSTNPGAAAPHFGV